jgi:hypothetical protein
MAHPEFFARLLVHDRRVFFSSLLEVAGGGNVVASARSQAKVFVASEHAFGPC